MPFTEPEKTRLKTRNELLEEIHQHDFKGSGPTCAECGLLPADPYHSWTRPPGVVVPISETEGLRFEARNTENIDLYKHRFFANESTRLCRECALPSGDEIHGLTRGTGIIKRNEDL